MATESYDVPLAPARAEISVLNSRFIASLEYADSVASARGFMARVRAEFGDASHNVPAFIVGGGNSRTEYCSDDGEPSGTSGRPLLAVLRGSGLGDVAVVVTRYFGGTLLGTGGLVKAYSEAGKRVLELTRRGVLREVVSIRAAVPYAHFDALRLILPTFGAVVAREEFSESVRLEVEVPADEVGRFISAVSALTSGAVSCEELGSRMARLASPDSAGRSR